MIELDFKKLFGFAKYESLSGLERMINNRVWELAIPTIRRKYFIKKFDIAKFKQIESKFWELNSKNFPEEYYFVMYLWKTISESESDKLNAYCYSSELFNAIRYKCRLLANSGHLDCVTELFKGEIVQKMRKKEDKHKFMMENESFVKAFKILVKHEVIFIDDDTVPKIDDSKILKTIAHDIFGYKTKKTNLIKNVELLDEGQQMVVANENFIKTNLFNMVEKLSDSIYGYDIVLKYPNGHQNKIYTMDMWDIQKKFLNHIRKLHIYNIGTFHNIFEPFVYTNTESYERLNERQKTALKNVVSKYDSVSFCTGLPGTGKTEVIKSSCKALTSAEALA